MIIFESLLSNSIIHSFNYSTIVLSTGTRIRTLIKGFGDLYSTVELFPYLESEVFKCINTSLFLFYLSPGQPGFKIY